MPFGHVRNCWRQLRQGLPRLWARTARDGSGHSYRLARPARRRPVGGVCAPRGRARLRHWRNCPRHVAPRHPWPRGHAPRRGRHDAEFGPWRHRRGAWPVVLHLPAATALGTGDRRGARGGGRHRFRGISARHRSRPRAVPAAGRIGFTGRCGRSGRARRTGRDRLARPFRPCPLLRQTRQDALRLQPDHRASHAGPGA